MKKLSIALLVCSALLLSACSNSKKAESTDTTSKQETKTSSTDELKKKEAAKANKRAEEAEKKKQEEISKKVLEADTAMKNAEANPTNETLATAKTAIEAIPGGNADLQKRLETATANLEAIKQQAAQIQQQPTNSDPNFIDADGNGFDDRSPMNDDSTRAQAAAQESAAQTRYWEAYNNGASPGDALAYADGRSDNYNQQQNDAVDQLNQYRSDFQAQNGREPTSGEIQSQWLKEQGLE
ncbi:hypothetical protein [Enterococcus dongliensis]|uniref:hypothetical protein n=1 Tax=Enterococcus dongliensis TaxID=2559925 RepID=UPI00288CBD4D|nr:hypothetical protein [Enterococcus dongliensis]MDT2668149.1 hypothetical protein [Enterococcus dongliensis]